AGPGDVRPLAMAGGDAEHPVIDPACFLDRHGGRTSRWLPTAGAGMPVRGAAGTRVIYCFFAVPARPRHVVHAPGSLGIEGRCHAVSFGPGELLFGSEAAA